MYLKGVQGEEDAFLIGSRADKVGHVEHAQSDLIHALGAARCQLGCCQPQESLGHVQGVNIPCFLFCVCHAGVPVESAAQLCRGYCGIDGSQVRPCGDGI